MTQAVFLHGSLMRHVSVMSFTASVGIVSIFAVDFVDMVFISMLGQAELAAAIGYTGTLLFFTNAINIGLSIAAGSEIWVNHSALHGVYGHRNDEYGRSARPW